MTCGRFLRKWKRRLFFIKLMPFIYLIIIKQGNCVFNYFISNWWFQISWVKNIYFALPPPLSHKFDQQLTSNGMFNCSKQQFNHDLCHMLNGFILIFYAALLSAAAGASNHWSIWFWLTLKYFFFFFNKFVSCFYWLW